MKRRLLILGAVVAVALVIVSQLPVREGALMLADWAEANPRVSAVGFVVVFAGAIVLMVPAWIFMVLAGYIFGWINGVILVSVAYLLAAPLTFLIGRTLARASIEQRVHAMPRFSAMDRAVEQNGFAIALLSRLAQIIPYNLLNYAFGLTAISMRHYLVGTMIGAMPSFVLFVFIGAKATDLSALLSGDFQGTTDARLFLISSVVGLVALIFLITRLAARTLKRELGETPVSK